MDKVCFYCLVVLILTLFGVLYVCSVSDTYGNTSEFFSETSPVNTIIEVRMVKKALLKLFIKTLTDRGYNNDEFFVDNTESLDNVPPDAVSANVPPAAVLNLFKYISNPPNTSTSTDTTPGLLERLEELEIKDFNAKSINEQCVANKTIYSDPQSCVCQFTRGLDICFYNEYPVDALETIRTIIYDNLFDIILQPSGVLNKEYFDILTDTSKVDENSEFVYKIDANKLFDFSIFEVTDSRHNDFVELLKFYLLNIVRKQLSIIQTRLVEESIIKEKRKSIHIDNMKAIGSEGNKCIQVVYDGTVDDCMIKI